MNGESVIFGVLNIAFVLLISPFFMMVIKRVKARVQCRTGPHLLQGYYNLAKLFTKETLYSEYAGFISRIAPYATLSILLVAALQIPLFWIPGEELITANILVFLYLFVAGRLLIALLGLDTASTFGGMGSSREMSLSAVFEPVTVIVCAALVYVMGSFSIHEIFRTAHAMFPVFSPTVLLLSVPLFILIIVETGRVPVDNPETHLELTMIHEGMLLDTSGRNLALFELSQAVKQTLLMTILINVVFPVGIALDLSIPACILGAVLFVVKGTILCVIIGFFESAYAKMRLFQIPNFFMIAFFFSILTIFIEVIL